MKNLGGFMAMSSNVESYKIFIISICLFISHFITAQTQTMEPTLTDDAFMQGNSRITWEPNQLRMDNGSRIAYMKFNIPSIPGTVTSAVLQFTIFADGGNGTLEIYKGTSNNWLETDLSSTNRPGQGALLGSINKTYTIGNTENVVLDENEISTGQLSLILTHVSGGDFAIASKENPTSSIRPKLIVTYATTSADTQAPNIPTGLTVNSFDHESANISWNASTDNGGGNVVGYNIYNNGNPFALVTTGTSYTMPNLAPNTTYQLSIDAYDNASPSNHSLKSSTVNFTTSSTPGNPGTGSGNWTLSGDNAYRLTGNIGIGTVNSIPTNGDPNYKLAVNGSVRAKEIKVEAGWADYVFFKNYNLPTLQEVEKHIQEKGHLINIPSAAEVEANGIELGEMNKLLLEKIEELTLYTIEQQKAIQKLQTEVKAFKND